MPLSYEAFERKVRALRNRQAGIADDVKYIDNYLRDLQREVERGYREIDEGEKSLYRWRERYRETGEPEARRSVMDTKRWIKSARRQIVQMRRQWGRSMSSRNKKERQWQVLDREIHRLTYEDY